jgi:stage V sporulation protein D (sporulation-specific penicillin-binding protein)
MKSHFVTRVRVISIALLIFALLLIGKLYVLQIVDHSVYLDKADRQYTSAQGGLFDRGTIFFQNKDGSVVSGATLKSGFTIAVNPEVLKDPEVAYEKISAIIPIDHDSFIAKATKKGDPYEEIAKRVDTDAGQKISDLKIPGLQSYKERWRFYPGGASASQTVGIVGFKGDEFAGRYGLERQYESILKRNDGAYVNFFAQIFSNIQTAVASTSESEGDVVTTIEPTVQSVLEQELASTTSKWSSDLTGGIIMDPSTGEIFALGVYPTFDPNNPQAEKDVSTFSNPLVENVYEMGSIIKPLTVAAGIDAGVITASSTYNDTGYIMVNGKKISNFDGKARGITTIQDLISQSLNVGAAHVESLLGNQRFSDYMYRFGLDKKTGIDLPNEGKDLVDNLKSPRDIEHATASFGQGIALTPLATVRALAAIANGGTLIQPHVVKRIEYKMGWTKDVSPPPGERVIKPETARAVAGLMTYSVDNVLLGGTTKLPNYNVAAKTGTAQIAKKGGGGYSETEILHSFIGWVPSYNPRFLIFLYTVNPKGVKYGSETLTLPFHSIVEFLTNYYEIPPDR